MKNVVYMKNEFMVFKVDNGFIAFNSRLKFAEGHTHLKSLKQAVDAIRFVMNKKIPRRANIYYLSSLKRLSIDEEYNRKITELQDTRIQKGHKLNCRKHPHFSK
jgi:hypothetical protein